jgi:hypothetical protein
MEYAEEAAAHFDRDGQAGSGDGRMATQEGSAKNKSQARKVS